jgi:hypothetical protein
MELDQDQLQQFRDTGLLVIENVFDHVEVDILRKQFHTQLEGIGFNHEKILSGEYEMTGGPRIKSDISKIFYNRWKFLGVQLNPKVVNLMGKLLIETYGKKIKDFDHPYEKFDDVLVLAERVCYRLPDNIRKEGGLSLHVDRSPTDPYLFREGGLDKWRPIQGFVSLTDHFGGGYGGLRVVEKFHTKFDDYFKGKDITGKGEFYRMGKEHTLLQKTCQPVYAPAGSLVCWDNRLPHSTCDTLNSFDTREVVYLALIPNTKINKTAVLRQHKAIIRNETPPHFAKHGVDECDRDWDIDELDNRQKELLMFKVE